MEAPKEKHLRFALRVGPNVVTCVGILAGENLIPPAETFQYIDNPSPAFLLISCGACTESKDISASIEVRASRHPGKTEQIVLTGKGVSFDCKGAHSGADEMYWDAPRWAGWLDSDLSSGALRERLAQVLRGFAEFQLAEQLLNSRHLLQKKCETWLDTSTVNEKGISEAAEKA